MNKVLISGANGLLASHIIRVLIEQKIATKAMVRKTANIESIKDLNTELFYGDFTNKTDLTDAAQDCNYIIHAAANTSQYPTDLSYYSQVNIVGTKTVIEVAKELNIKRLLFVSTANTIDFGSKEEPGNELSRLKPWLHKSGYAFSKYLAQQAVIDATKKDQLDAVIVNPGFMLGPYDVKPSSGQILLMALKSKICFYPPGGKSFIYVRDAAIGTINALFQGRKGECYLLVNSNLSYREFFKKTQQLAGKRTIRIYIPKGIILLAGLCGSIIEKIFKKPVRLNFINARMLVTGNYFSSRKAVQELALPQTDIDRAVTEALSWFRDNGYF